jgi:hypothetical protein
MGTEGTSRFFTKNGIKMEKVFKVGEGRSNVVDFIKNMGRYPLSLTHCLARSQGMMR